jgi:tetratricopeptide (TPR) repeat protein
MKIKLLTMGLVMLFASAVVQGQVVRVEFFKDYPMAASQEANEKLMNYNAEQLTLLIAKLQERLEGESGNNDVRQNLAALLTRKAVLLSNEPYHEIEELLYKADQYLPSSFGVEAVWGDILLKNNKTEEALMHYDNAIALEPSNGYSGINTNLYIKAGFSAANTMHYDKAAHYFSQITRVEPENFTAQLGAGTAYFDLRSFADALEHLEAAHALAPTESEKDHIEKILAQVREYLASTDSSTTEEDQRFIVHFAGDSRDDIGDLTFDMLDDIYYQVTESLNYDPQVKITIIFFLTEDYYKVAQQWSAGAAQGIQIMVPLKSGYKSPDYVKGLLAHEFTHTIIHLKTRDRCPLWLNEGLAQFHEFQAERGSYEDLRPDFESLLENEFIEKQSFVTLNRAQAMIARGRSNAEITKGYLASYLAVRCIADFYGEQSFDELLGSLGEGKTIDEALEASIGKNLSEFEEEYFDWLRNF